MFTGQVRRHELRVLHGDGIVEDGGQVPTPPVDVIDQLIRPVAAVEEFRQEDPGARWGVPVIGVTVQRNKRRIAARQQVSGPGGISGNIAL